MAELARSVSKELKETLWKAANKLRGTLPASQYKDVILGLIFLKYVSDADDERPNGEFKVPPAARWKSLADNAKADNIGQLVDQAMAAVMKANPALARILPQRYHGIDPRRLGELRPREHPRHVGAGLI